jgi:light-regulated signal transduction histidine kinase (bacteriophytochrome)
VSKLTPNQAKALRAAIRQKPNAELRAAFALIREHSDRTLLAAISPVRKTAKQTDPLLRELEQILKPVIAPASEKADMLVEHLAKKHRKTLTLTPKGMADAVRQLRAKFTDAQISAGAKSLMANLAKLYGDRETVV